MRQTIKLVFRRLGWRYLFRREGRPCRALSGWPSPPIAGKGTFVEAERAQWFDRTDRWQRTMPIYEEGPRKNASGPCRRP